MLAAGHVAALASVIKGIVSADRRRLAGRFLLLATGLFGLR
jgi:hypothetical protein